MQKSEKGSASVLIRQIIFIIVIIAIFVTLWGVVWMFVTSRCVNHESDEMKIKMIDVSQNLPFDEDSHIVHYRSSTILKDDLPVLDGAAALFPVYSAFTEALYPEKSVIYNNETGDFEPDSVLQFHNTVQGFNALINGDVDIFFSVYPSKEQLKYADEKGVELEFVPIGKEAFVFLVNINNPVDSLTQDELRGLFTGKYKNWKQVGGADRPVHPIKRIAGSGSQSALEAFLGGEKIYTNPLGFMGASIGYSFRWYTTEVVNDGDVKILSVDGVYPDAETIRDGSYPLTSCFYAIYRRNNRKQTIGTVIDFVLSEEGQALIEASGYCRISKE